ncbi:MAG TPA: mannose-1-phosphate guanylyltransferase [Candidatus Polarisedimenticolia bacterium]|nr:mannose-1-phosphate guanylyltransferase [Candidatus Polarisedimenticolia bacterium]
MGSTTKLTHGVYHVIMAGGSGTRFWPVSRSARPKQFLSLVGDRPLIRQAWERAAEMSGPSNVFVAAGVAHRSMILDAIPGMDPLRLIAEPFPRNTAPCVGLAALRLEAMDPEAVLVMAPADHVYTRPDALREALDAAVEAARSRSALVTLGIRPSRPDTGYGYIEVAPEAPGGNLPGIIRKAERFVEKPDAATAARYVGSGSYLWNSGLFVWRVRTILDALRDCAPDLWGPLVRIRAALGSPEESDVLEEAFERMPSISIDYAVLEKASDVLVVPADPGWSDVGSWDAVAELQQTDAAGNSAVPEGRSILLESRDCLVFGGEAGSRIVALVGAEDLMVVDSGDALLICRKGRSQSVRAIVQALKDRGRDDLL